MFTVCAVVIGHAWYNEGLTGVLEIIVKTMRKIPGVEGVLQQILSKEVKQFTQQTKGHGKAARVSIPAEGNSHIYIHMYK